MLEQTDMNGEPSTAYREDLVLNGKCWKLGEGLEVWAVLYEGVKDKYFADCRPGFRGRYIYEIRPWELVEYYEDGEAVVRGKVREKTDIIFELQNFTDVKPNMLRDISLSASMAALAWDVRFLQPGPGTAPSFTSAMGYSNIPGENEYRVTGRVLASRRIINPVSGQPVLWLYADCGPIKLEIVTSYLDADPPQPLNPGTFVTADVWLQGHVLTEEEITARYEGVDMDYQKSEFWGLLRRSN